MKPCFTCRKNEVEDYEHVCQDCFDRQQAEEAEEYENELNTGNWRD